MKKTSIIISIAIAIAVVFTAMASLATFAAGATENEFVGASLSLGESINVNYFATLKIEDAENAHVEFAYNGETFVAEPLAVEGKTDYYKFVFENLAPQCMGNNISATLVVNGESVDTVEEYSVLQNCQNLIEDETVNASTKQLVYDLLAYGAAAQNYADYKTDALVNAGYEDKATTVTSIENEDRTVSAPDVEGARFIAFGVYYANVNKVYAKIEIDGADASAITATVNGETAEIEKYGSEEYIIFSEAIPVSQFDKVYTIKITDGVNEQTITYSVNAYAKAKMDAENKYTAELAKATYAYGQSAKAYVEYMEQQHHTICGDTCDCGADHIEILAWKPIKNAEELQAAANAGGNYYLTEDISLSATISVRADMNLCMNGKKLVATNSQIFVINNKALTITDCTANETVGYIENGKWVEGAKEGAEAVVLKGGILMDGSTSYGGAIQVQAFDSNTSSLTLYNVNLVNNSATTQGGAIYANKATLNINNSVLVGSSSVDGGAIYAKNASININNSKLDSNKATSTANVGGGAVYAQAGSLSVNDSVFTNNESGGRSGAIYIESISGFSIKNTSFIGGVAKSTSHGGGVSYISGSTGTMENVTFVGNTAYKGGALGIHGGSNVTINGLTATGNVATNLGGVFTLNNSTLTINAAADKPVSISGNSAVSGGVFHAENGSKVNINGGTIESNTASANGGAINIAETSVYTINGTTFKSNGAVNGGAIYHGGSKELYITNAIFTSNTATTSGGAINSISKSTITVTGGEFKSNTSATSGGAIYTLDTVLNVSGTTFNANKTTTATGAGGGAIWVQRGNISVIGSTFTNNESAGRAGAIYFEAVTGFSVKNSTFDGGTAKSTTHGGGVSYISGSTGTMENVTFTNNKAYKGGALGIHGSSNVTINGVTATGNVATNLGGVFTVNNSTLTVNAAADKPVSISGNSAVSGGVFNAENAAKIYINGGTIESNTASANGGAVNIIETSIGTINGTTFKNNSATVNGGAIYHGGSKEIIVTDATFTGNTAGDRGGAICANGSGKVTVNGTSVFTSNKTLGTSVIAAADHGRGGGAIYVGPSATVDVTGAAFNTNSNGGSYYDGPIDNGGAIHVNGGTLIASNSTFTGNTSQAGGAIGCSDLASTTMTVTNCTFTNNTGTKNGGAIFIQNNVNGWTITFNNCTFEGNSTTGGGSAMYVRTGAYVTINGITYNGGTAPSWGHAIYATGATTQVKLMGTPTFSASTTHKVNIKNGVATVIYADETEKAAWEGVIRAEGTPTITYTPAAQ